VRYVLFYQSADDVLEKAPLHYAAHSARVDEFAQCGDLLLVGTFEDPVAHGSMSVFATREAAEEFVAGDPFVSNGVVRAYGIRGWDEILGGELAAAGEAVGE
jgi:uncharacterized protein YciI